MCEHDKLTERRVSWRQGEVRINERQKEGEAKSE